MHQLGGYLQNNLKTAAGCLNGCIATSTCLAADFNSAANQCYFHDSTGCGTLVAKTACSNFQLATCRTYCNENDNGYSSSNQTLFVV